MMKVKRIEGPAPFVTSDQISGAEDTAQATVQMFIAAAQRRLDGLNGILGRSLGAQTLELTASSFCRKIRLPYPPIVDVTKVMYLNRDGTEAEIASENWRVANDMLTFESDFDFPEIGDSDDAVRITYRAGYDDGSASEGESMVPDEAKVAVILLAQHMLSAATSGGAVRSEEVHDVATIQYSEPTRVDAFITGAVENLVHGLRVIG